MGNIIIIITILPQTTTKGHSWIIITHQICHNKNSQVYMSFFTAYLFVFMCLQANHNTNGMLWKKLLHVNALALPNHQLLIKVV